ncbi:DUF2235 domain-containing protein [Alcaligenaceae bacterium]|nr:DUF2235 domain-containing protein [Alcaligenaceae bacterium]
MPSSGAAMPQSPFTARLFRIILLSLSVLCPAAHGQGVCSPPALGDPCVLGGIATAGATEPALGLGAGNPIHLGTGNKYQHEIDLPAAPPAPDLELSRHYNAMAPQRGILGRGWTLSYDTRLRRAGPNWRIVQADGSHIEFQGIAGMPMANAHGSLQRERDGWVWRWPDGRRLWFDQQGDLSRIRGAVQGVRPYRPGVRPRMGSDPETTIHRHADAGPLAGMIERISASDGSALTFRYRIDSGTAYLDHVNTRHGRFQYRYEQSGDHAEPRLSAVIRPDGMQRRYLYEAALQSGNAHALTGIELIDATGEQAERVNTWAYDRQGRAIQSIAGDPAHPRSRLTIEYRQPISASTDGLTVVHGDAAQSTSFRIGMRGGRHVLLASDGPGCPGCPPTGQRAEYDDHGRLTRLNDTELIRHADGRLQTIMPLAPGWPGLALHYHAGERRHAWSSGLTGHETLFYTARGLPQRRVFANGDSTSYDYDRQGRPVRITNTSGMLSDITTLAWKGTVPIRIQHPQETEWRDYDDRKRLRRRSVRRVSAVPGPMLNYDESFDYDEQDRLVAHHLPEGGSIRYRWGAGKRLLAIAWHPELGRPQTVIDSVPGLAGYRYGNGLHLHVTAGRDGQARQLVLSSDSALMWVADLAYDGRGLLSRETHHLPGHASALTQHLAYDAHNRLAVFQDASGDSTWFAWNGDGSLALMRSLGASMRPDIRRDATGLPKAVGKHEVAYGSNRRLARVSLEGRPVADYLHNAFGYRIAKRSEAANVDYFYLDNRLVAETRRAAGPVQQVSGPARMRVGRRYLYAHHVPVGFIDYHGPGNGTATLYAVHADTAGAPALVTDARQAIRWSARYGPGGQAQDIRGDLRLDLRLPGQVHDDETGWHDNLLRTYLPGLGHYLEPDPLGPLPGHQALGYAGQQPRRYADPMGLLLFAFDGTRNSADTHSNVWKLSQAYGDGAAHYHAGPGNSLYLDWDAVTAWRASRIIENQWQSLLNGLNSASGGREHVPIDIIGFSRGAALARHFGNLIAERMHGRLFSYDDPVRGSIRTCVDLRFMGLFDTVAQFGLAGSHNSQYDLTIAAAWDWVAHAVALNERRWLFPVSSVASSAGANTVEAPFIGAHSDIGGGTLYDDGGQPLRHGDLSDVALNWMLWQARAATADFRLSDPADREISSPILHDERSPVLRGIQDGDRSVLAADGSKTHEYQDDHIRLGRRLRASAETLIARHDDWRSRESPEVGTVDLDGYAKWLHEELGWGAQPGVGPRAGSDP